MRGHAAADRTRQREGGGPLVYRVLHRTKAWRSGECPSLQQLMFEGSAPFSVWTRAQRVAMVSWFTRSLRHRRSRAAHSRQCALGKSGGPESTMFVSRIVVVGGKSRDRLRQELELSGVKLNRSAEELFANPAFVPSQESFLLECVAHSVADLGLAAAATKEIIWNRAAELGLALCPLETGPYLRLQYLDQPEGFLGYPPSRHRAPPGSLTIASPPLSEDLEAPKGFYLRRIRGELWLRGYRSGPEHVWSPEDRLVFCSRQSLT